MRQMFKEKINARSLRKWALCKVEKDTHVSPPKKINSTLRDLIKKGNNAELTSLSLISLANVSSQVAMYIGD